MTPHPGELPLHHLAQLARLHLTSERTAVLGPRLERVVAAFSVLGAVEPAGQAAPPAPTLPLRPDVVEPLLTVEAITQNAAKVAAGCFVVPRVVEG
jgi:aspartyl/glutamyl-tRNA(Asn/Gln) amidotransferase C subunit